MTEVSYPFEAKPIVIRYDFDSVSAEKTVLKAVVFSQLSPDIFNVALLDVLEDGLLSDDLVVTNNQDLRTVLATVIRIIDSFLTQFTGKIVLFRGSDEHRTRLYRIVISRELHLIQEQFRVIGMMNGKLEIFTPNRPYSAFYITKI
jgi:hypothetical protein